MIGRGNHLHKKKIGICLLVGMAILGILACALCRTGGWNGVLQNVRSEENSGQTAVTKQSFYFDTICQITIYEMAAADSGQPGDSEQNASGQQTPERTFEQEAGKAITDAFTLCSEYEKLLSKTVEDSDIWNINHAAGEAVPCDSRTIAVIEKGIQYGELSGGGFDITIGKAEDLWDFHEVAEQTSDKNDSDKNDSDENDSDENVSGESTSSAQGENLKEESSELSFGLPDETALAEAVSHVDYRNIQIDTAAGTVRLTDPEAEIDLGGIAKGYIADRVCEALEQAGVTAAIVSLGGNIECIGSKPDAIGYHSEDTEYGAFHIGIETPYSDRTEVVGSSELTDGTMVTSGVYERYITVDGKEYHHILDVQTGYPVDTDVLSVTIRGPAGTSADCDALSTTCLILGAEKGMDLIEKMDGYEALFIMQDESVTMTSGMNFTAAGE